MDSTRGRASFGVGANDLLLTTRTYVGNLADGSTSGSGTLYLEGGEHDVSDILYVGLGARSQGTYFLESGRLNSAETQVGNGGTGTFNQSGGEHDLTSRSLYVGLNGGSGAYNLTGGTFSAPASALIGYTGTGVFNQSAGTFIVGSATVGALSGGTGTYNLSGGTLATTGTTVGQSGNGTFVLTGGTHTVGGSGLTLGAATGGTGTYQLQSGTLQTTAIQRGAGTGTLVLDGGTLRAGADNANFITSGVVLAVRGGALVDTNGFNVTTGASFAHDGTAGAAAIDGGLYKLGAGSLTLSGIQTYTGPTHVQSGTLNLSGTIYTPNSSLSLLSFDGTAATFVLGVGGSLTTSATQVLDSGSGGAGFTQNGGTHATDSLIVGQVGPGAYQLVGGTLRAGSITLSTQTVGSSFVQSAGTQIFSGGVNVGGGTFTQNGGTHTITNALNFGGAFFNNNLRVGTFNLEGGTLSAARVSVGLGIFNLDGGTLTTGSFNLSQATVNLNGSTLQAAGSSTDFFARQNTTTTSNLYVLAGGARVDTQNFDVTVNQPLRAPLTGTGGGLTKLGTGTLTLTAANTYTGNTLVSAGTLAITGGSVGAANTAATLTVNGPASAGATANLSGDGTQFFTGTDYVGRDAVGTFTQSGGTHAVGGTLYLGFSGTNATAGNGTYNLSGGTLSTGATQVGNGGTGTFTQSGGTHVIDASSGGTLYLGLNNGTGTYNLSDGTLQTTSPQVGYTGTGVLNQTGGVHNVTGSLTLGSAAGSDGSYVLANGGATAQLTTTSRVYVGNNGRGTFTQNLDSIFSTGGNTLYVGYNAGSTGVYNLNNGELSTGDAVVGYAGTGTFNQNSGIYSNNGNRIYVGFSAGGAGTYNLNGGELVTSQVLRGGGTGTFNFNGGTLSAAGSRTDFLQGLSSANVRDGGAFFNTNGFTVTVAQPLLHSGLAGDRATDGGLTQFGTGTLVLTGSNTYTGPTTVVAGTLLVNNTSGSGTGTGPVAAINGSTLGGNGAILGNVRIGSGSILAPGAEAGLSVGRLTLGGTLTLQSNSLLAIELGGTGYDQVFAAGSLTLGGRLQVGLLDGFAPAFNQSFTVLDSTGNSLNSGVFSNAPGGLYTDTAGRQFLVNYLANADAGLVGNDVTLTYVGTVPEPGTWTLLLASGGLIVVWLNRGRRSRDA